MNRISGKRSARKFLRKLNGRAVSMECLRQFLSEQGFTLVFFNHMINDADTEAIISELRLADMISRAKGFTYADKNHRIVFLHETLPLDGQMMVLAHEVGHIYCGHFSHAPIIGQDVLDEYEANDFSHYILNPPIAYKLLQAIRQHKLLSICITIILVLAFAAAVFIPQAVKAQTYYKEFYVTATGSKYHWKDCSFVKDKSTIHRLTIEEFESGEYAPCQICHPEE